MLPKALSNLGNLGSMMKSAMELKGKMEEVKEALAQERIEASSGGGMVEVVVNGKMELLSLKIDPEIIDKDDPETLETMVRAAINEGVRKAHERVQEKMTEVAGGMNIPGLTS